MLFRSTEGRGWRLEDTVGADLYADTQAAIAQPHQQTVIPAQAGIHPCGLRAFLRDRKSLCMDPGFRRDDGAKGVGFSG